MKNNRGQTTIEYAFLIIIVIGALMAMNLYLKRGLQGRWKEAVDGLGDQYAPTNMLTDITHLYEANIITRVWSNSNNDGTISTLRNDEISSKDTKSGESMVTQY